MKLNCTGVTRMEFLWFRWDKAVNSNLFIPLGIVSCKTMALNVAQKNPREVVKSTVLEQGPPNQKIYCGHGLCLHSPFLNLKRCVFVA